MNREQRRRTLQPTDQRGPALEERNLQTNVGVDLGRGKVMLGFSFAVREVFMPPENAIQTAIHLIMAARRANPSLEWPSEERATAEEPGAGHG